MRYLSDEWIEAADAAVRAASPAPSGPLVVEQRVETDDGTRGWRTVFGAESRIEPAPAGPDGPPGEPPVDAVFSQSEATARAVATGNTDAHQAFLLGDIRFEGSVEALIEHRASFEWLEAALAPVMAVTDWD